MDEELPRPVRPLSIFSSYVDQDKELYDELEKHLSLLQREGTITIWDHRNIKAGANTKQVSSEQLEVAQIILLLISPDFLTSDAAYDEMQQALRRQKTDLAYVIPILLRPVDLKCTLFTDLQVLPRNSQPVTTWTDRDQAFAHIAKEIRLVVEQQQHVVTGSSIEPPTPPFAFVFISYAVFCLKKKKFLIISFILYICFK